MKRQAPAENTALVIALAIAFFGALALLGWNAGVFAKLDADERIALAAFAAGFAALTYSVDRQVHAAVGRAVSAIRAVFTKRVVVSSSRPRRSAARSNFSGIE